MSCADTERLANMEAVAASNDKLFFIHELLYECECGNRARNYQLRLPDEHNSEVRRGAISFVGSRGGACHRAGSRAGQAVASHRSLSARTGCRLDCANGLDATHTN